jgi:DAK2 domain fusion protein YloV
MGTLARLGADELRAAMEGFRDALRAHQTGINRLNVYPVPDGDTGTNMALTLGAVCEELDGADPDLAAVCQAIRHGSLMGGRGNSGVILSQVLRGMAGVAAEAGGLDAAGAAGALTAASTAAYEAVTRPVEGTILTVVRECAEAAAAREAAGGDLLQVLEAARHQGGDALARTPEMLPVLAKAGVVDAGGTGFLLLLDVLLHLVDGRDVPGPEEIDELPMEVLTGHGAAGAHGDISDLRYEVMYLLEAADESIPGFKDVWAGIGDSIVVVGGEGLWNCHIHTDDIGSSIEAAIDIGRPRKIRVTDLIEQVEEERWVRDAADAGAFDEIPAHLLTPVTCAVVAVATGEGIRRIFHSLGAQGIVTGGQSMNPSTADLLAAVEAVPADQVVLLPNNKNIIPVAEQVDELTSKQVLVVRTVRVTEGFAALVAYDPEAEVGENLAEMTEAADRVVAGEVTQAVRDSSCDVGPIAEGDWLGIGADDGILAVEPELPAAATALLERLVADDHEIVTIIEGEGASAGATRHITEWLAEHRPDVAAEVHHGGQPLYPYLFGVE